MWWTSAPQQPSSATITSMPWRVRSADGRRIDRRSEHRPDAAVQQRHAAAAGVPPAEIDAALPGRVRGQPGRRQSQHGGDRREPERREQAGKRLAQPRRAERPAEATVVRQHAGKDRAEQAIGQRARIGSLDMGARVVDQVHVVHARGAGGHAGQARQAAVDMLDDLGRRRPVVLQHVLDQVDAPARGIELVAEQHVGRAGRGAEAAMHAGAQDSLRFRDVRVGELREGERGLHAACQD